MTSPATHVTTRETREQALTLVQATITPACSRAEKYPIPDDRADFAPLAIKAEENSLFELLPGFSTLILQALIDASKFSAIPGLDQVASAALSIVQTIQVIIRSSAVLLFTQTFISYSMINRMPKVTKGRSERSENMCVR